MIEDERWERAIKRAREALEIYKTIPNGWFAAGWIAADIESYEKGDRDIELLESLESIKL